jgi:hypothetical protein
MIYSIHSPIYRSFLKATGQPYPFVIAFLEVTRSFLKYEKNNIYKTFYINFKFLLIFLFCVSKYAFLSDLLFPELFVLSFKREKTNTTTPTQQEQKSSQNRQQKPQTKQQTKPEDKMDTE